MTIDGGLPSTDDLGGGMANSFETLQAHVEASGWVFALGHLEEWRQVHPDGTLDDYLDEVRQHVDKAKARFIEIEMENGATRETAERVARLMH